MVSMKTYLFAVLIVLLGLYGFAPLQIAIRSALAAVADGHLPPREVTFPIRPLNLQRGTVRRCYPLQRVPV